MGSEEALYHIVECPDYEQLCDELAGRLLLLSNEAIQMNGRFTIAFSGGSTPKGLYRKMSESPYAERFNWPFMHFFFGDERWVAPDDIRSNYRMAAEVLLAKADIPPENIHPIKTRDLHPEASASAYHDELVSHFKLSKGEYPVFDVVLLGLGQDGHVASLFPGSPALDEKKRLVVSALDDELNEKRITLTLPVINSARHIIFMVSGKEKARAIHTVLESDENRYALPARLVRSERGSLTWYLDKSAGFFLTKLKKITL